MVHILADVQTANIGKQTFVWQFAVILAGAKIGNNCNINCHTFIENKVEIGDNVTVKSGVFIWDGTTIEDNVFIGPNVTFTNDKYPRSKQYPAEFQKIVIKHGASIGANATILGGTEIGCFSVIGAGSVVTKMVPSFALVLGNPARIVGWVDEIGSKLTSVDDDTFVNNKGQKFKIVKDQLKEL